MNLEVITRKGVNPKRPTPLLFVHGAWHGAWCWSEHFLDFFAEHGYDLYAFSLRAHGNSPGREKLRWARVSGYMEDLRYMVGQIKPSPVLIGHSMGGFTVMKYLEHHPAPAGVLLSAVPSVGAMPALLRFIGRHPLAAAKIFLRLSPKEMIATPALTREAFFSLDMPEEELLRYYAQMQEESFGAFLDMVLLRLPKPRLVKTPLMVIGAAKDGIFTVSEALRTGRAYGTEAVIIPGIAHDVMLEAKWKVVANLVLEWLEARGL